MAELTDKAAQKLSALVAKGEQETEPSRAATGVQALTRQMHLGIIVDEGPLAPDEDPDCEPEEGEKECAPVPLTDFDDARYWVQSAFVSNASNDADEQAEIKKYDKDVRPDRYKLRAVTNLFEEVLGTHVLPPGQIVSFWQQPDRSTNPMPLTRWLMNVVTSSVQFCVVRSTQPDDHFVTVQLVRIKVRPERGEQWNGEVQSFGDTFMAACYPIMKGKHFKALVVPGSGEQDVNQGWPILQLLHINGIWFVSPWTKRFIVPVTHAHGLRLDDCNPLRGVER